MWQTCDLYHKSFFYPILDLENSLVCSEKWISLLLQESTGQCMPYMVYLVLISVHQPLATYIYWLCLWYQWNITVCVQNFEAHNFLRLTIFRINLHRFIFGDFSSRLFGVKNRANPRMKILQATKLYVPSKISTHTVQAINFIFNNVTDP